MCQHFERRATIDPAGACERVMVYVKASFALVPNTIAYIAGVSAFVCRMLARPPLSMKPAIVIHIKIDSDLPIYE